MMRQPADQSKVLGSLLRQFLVDRGWEHQQHSPTEFSLWPPEPRGESPIGIAVTLGEVGTVQVRSVDGSRRSITTENIQRLLGRHFYNGLGTEWIRFAADQGAA